MENIQTQEEVGVQQVGEMQSWGRAAIPPSRPASGG